MTRLLALLGGPLGAWVLAAVAAAFVALGGYAGVQTLRVAGLKADVATLGKEKAELAGKLEVQNAAVMAIAKDCEQKADAAVAAAVRAFNTPAPPANGSGPQVMNRWLEARFARP